MALYSETVIFTGDQVLGHGHGKGYQIRLVLLHRFQ